MTLTAAQRPSQEKVLVSVPSLLSLYGKAVTPGVSTLTTVVGKVVPKRNARPVVEASKNALPEVTYVARGVRFDQDNLAKYQALLGFPRTDSVPAGFVHVTAFPVAMSLMVSAEFPLQLMGMVHVSNHVEAARALSSNEVFDIYAWANNLTGHSRGTTVDLVAEVWVGTEVVWRGTSTYLAKGKFLKGKGDPTPEREPFEAPTPTGLWSLDSGIGRDYAGVSGDINPIHLSALSAKALGFPKAIAHGMYTASRALAEAGPLVGDSFTWDVEFAKPVLLPGKVAVAITSDQPTPTVRRTRGSSRVHFTGWNARKNQIHFHGTIAPLAEND